jgi:hypothetical protein
MKVKFLGESDPCVMINGKIYECLGEEHDCYRVIDEEGFDEDEELQGYLYPKEMFEVVEE